MKPENEYFYISPRVVLKDTNASVVIRPKFAHVGFVADATYEVTYKPMEDLGSKSSFSSSFRPECKLIDGSLTFHCILEEEQEHSFVVDEIQGNDRRRIGDFRLYSVEKDLFNKRPYKGDLHMHSYRSDGLESPGYVAASCRKIGMDFMAITDHRQYGPSIEAQQAFESMNIDLQIFRGEEVHPPENPIHIVNFGGSESVNEIFADPLYKEEVAVIQKKLTDLPADLDPYYYASSLWCFDRIRSVGGLGIFCHPYWESQNRYHIPGSLTSRMFEEQPYDAYELIGGYHLSEIESNMLQVLRYQEELKGGKQIPIVGVSDAHGCDRGELFGWYYTIVFADSSELGDLIGSIKRGYSVAVESLPESSARAHGPFRFAKYALFLIREVFPYHDKLCLEEGLLMTDHLSGDAEAKGKVERLSGRTAEYLSGCFS